MGEGSDVESSTSLSWNENSLLEPLVSTPPIFASSKVVIIASKKLKKKQLFKGEKVTPS